MGSRADFYVGIGNQAEWLGTLLNNGDVWHTPLEIIIQESQIMYEELVIEHLKNNNGIIKDDGGKWPHKWQDSLMTDYSYIFDKHHEQVFMHQAGCDYLLNPLKIIQGYGLIESFTLLERPAFPIMLKLKEGATLSYG
jgi:hypothetical protein